MGPSLKPIEVVSDPSGAISYVFLSNPWSLLLLSSSGYSEMSRGRGGGGERGENAKQSALVMFVDFARAAAWQANSTDPRRRPENAATRFYIAVKFNDGDEGPRLIL